MVDDFQKMGFETATVRNFKNHYKLSRPHYVATQKFVILLVKMFFEVQTLRGLPGGFRFRADPVVLKLSKFYNQKRYKLT